MILTNKIKLKFKRCTKPEPAFQYKGKTIKKIGFQSTMFFIDSTKSAKLSMRMTQKKEIDFEDIKKYPIYIEFGKMVTIKP